MSARARTWALASCLGALLALALAGQYRASLPREPRLVFTNDGASAIARLVVEAATGGVEVGRVGPGGSAILPIEPRAGGVYSIDGNHFSGDELIRHLEYARRERADVRLGVDVHGCGWIEDEGVRHFDGQPTKRRIEIP